MFGMLEIFTGAKAVVSLVPPIIKVIDTLKKQKREPTLDRVIQQVRLDALESAQALRSEIIAVLHDFHDMHVSPDTPLSRLGEDLSWVSDPLKKRRIQKRRDRVNDIHRNLTSATDQLGSVLACMHRIDGLGDAYSAADAIRRELDGVLFNEPSMGQLLETYLRLLDEYISGLQG